MTKDTLPKTKSKKMINIDEFVKLAEKVKMSIQEEVEYIKERNERNGNNTSSKFSSIS